MNTWKKQACEPLFHRFFKVFKTCHQEKGQDTYPEQFPQVWVILFWVLVWFSILQSPHNVALIFRTCQLHTAWELLTENGSNERQAAWHGKLHWQGIQHPRKYKSIRFIDTEILYPY